MKIKSKVKIRQIYHNEMEKFQIPFICIALYQVKGLQSTLH